MGKLMDRLYDNLEDAKAFVLSFTNFVYFYDDVSFGSFQTIVCEKCKKGVQIKDYLAPKANCKKPTGILHTLEFGVNQEVRDELIARFDITDEDFRPIYTKRGELVYYQITPRHVMLPIHKENQWPIARICSECGFVQYDDFRQMNEKGEPYFFISQSALDDLHDLSVTYEEFRLHTKKYVISRRVYDFLTDRYPRTHYFPVFLKENPGNP